MNYVFKLLNILVVIAISILYVEVLKYIMSVHVSFFGNVLTTLEKISMTGTAAAVSLALMFIGNRYITRQNFMSLGFTCSIVALVYFYQIHNGGNIIVNIVMTFTYFYSALAFIFL